MSCLIHGLLWCGSLAGQRFLLFCSSIADDLHIDVIDMSCCSILWTHQGITFSISTWTMAAGVLSSAGSRSASCFKRGNRAREVPSWGSFSEQVIDIFRIFTAVEPILSDSWWNPTLPRFPLGILVFCGCQSDWLCLTSLTSAGLPTTGKAQTNKGLWKFTHSPLSAGCLVD